MYLKTTYKNDPIFQNTKTVFTIYNNTFDYKFNGDLIDKVKMLDIDDSMLTNLESGDFEGFIKIGIEYSDSVIKAGEKLETNLDKLFNKIPGDKKVDKIDKEDDYLESYYNLYHELVG